MGTRHEVLEHLKQHGSFSLAYSTLQPGVRHFVTKLGYFAYEQKWGYTFVLSDPVAAPKNHAELLDQFLKIFPSPTFWQVTESIARLLESRGFYVNHMGADMELDLRTYDFAGRKKAKLRQAMRKWSGPEYEIAERQMDEVDQDELRNLVRSWKSTRIVKRHELRFLTRPMVYKDEMDVRKFYAYHDGRLVGLLFFDPIYRGGEVIGYNTATKRRIAGAPGGLEEAMTSFAIKTFQGEGRTVLYTGLLPLYRLEKDTFRNNKLLAFAFRQYARFGENWFLPIFNFQGHNAFKHRFRGKVIKVYHASQAYENTLRVLAFGVLTAVSPFTRSVD